MQDTQSFISVILLMKDLRIYLIRKDIGKLWSIYLLPRLMRRA